MSFFRRPDYRSDTTNFINDLKQQKPELDKQQQAGRALLKRAKQEEAAVEEQLTAGMTADEQASLLAALRRIAGG